ncbi:Fe-S cluster assembly sulfur transfer protein SufU [Pseudomonadota bacterium]
MNDLRDLYQEVIFDHNRNPRNFGEMDDGNRSARGDNPLCGDQLTLYLKVNKDNVIEKIKFNGHGCAISTASASIMTEMLKGKTMAEAESLFNEVHDYITSESGSDTDSSELGKVQVLGGVRDYPSRVKCATLAWHTAHAAIAGSKDPATTE